MKTDKKIYTTGELCEKLKIRRSQVDFLCREYPEFPYRSQGRGRPRVFDQASVEFILKWLHGNRNSNTKSK